MLVNVVVIADFELILNGCCTLSKDSCDFSSVSRDRFGSVPAFMGGTEAGEGRPGVQTPPISTALPKASEKNR